MERLGYLRVNIMTAPEGKQELSCMTSIQVSIPKGLSYRVAKLHALEYIEAELARYGLQEALSPLGLAPKEPGADR